MTDCKLCPFITEGCKLTEMRSCFFLYHVFTVAVYDEDL